MSQEVHNITYNLNAYDEAAAISRAAGGLQASNEVLADTLNRMMRVRPEPVRRVVSRPSIFQQAFMGAAIAGRMRPTTHTQTGLPRTVVTTGRPIKVDHRGASLFDNAQRQSRAASLAMDQQRARAARVQREAAQHQRAVSTAQPSRFRAVDPRNKARTKARLERGGFTERRAPVATQPSHSTRITQRREAAIDASRRARAGARARPERRRTAVTPAREQGDPAHIFRARAAEAREEARARGMGPAARRLVAILERRRRAGQSTEELTDIAGRVIEDVGRRRTVRFPGPARPQATQEDLFGNPQRLDVPIEGFLRDGTSGM